MHPNEKEIQHQAGVIRELGPAVDKLIERHLGARKLWYPTELLHADDRDELRQRARDLPQAARAGLVLNLLTEEGLPHFHRLIATHMGMDSQWAHWNNLWTAEEDRHGCVLRDYARDSGCLDMLALEKLQYAYLEAGFDPQWHGEPYRLVAYTSLQEKATQYSHANLARLAAPAEPRLQHILARIAADEGRHHLFYRDTFALLLEADPERALKAAWAVMPKLAMPGHTIPGFNDLAEVARAAGIYGPMDYCRIVSELLSVWGIAAARGLSKSGERLRERLLELPERLQRFAHIVTERRKNVPSMQFDFLMTR